ncbi:hypothetical protein Vadar_033015 [Vaccinium darrowii]|uniref:Uncharacterized protein n=1 Tax=Vaccinium darrowii TaxID=229202 RepID=A0ACB7ZP29_9ERIC|nr:hypothetical protein Vadar_033015 [Vaccinium darrowii]
MVVVINEKMQAIGKISSHKKIQRASGYRSSNMIDDQDLGFFANFLGIFVFALVIAYHYVVADPKYEGN